MRKLLTWKKPFYLLTPAKGGYRKEYVTDKDNFSLSIANMCLKVEQILNKNKVIFKKTVSEFGSVYYVTDKNITVRVSDHPSRTNDEQRKIYHLGLYEGSDGDVTAFGNWLRTCTFEWVF
jgi:hypothetical protein